MRTAVARIRYGNAYTDSISLIVCSYLGICLSHLLAFAAQKTANAVFPFGPASHPTQKWYSVAHAGHVFTSTLGVWILTNILLQLVRNSTPAQSLGVELFQT